MCIACCRMTRASVIRLSGIIWKPLVFLCEFPICLTSSLESRAFTPQALPEVMHELIPRQLLIVCNVCRNHRRGSNPNPPARERFINTTPEMIEETGGCRDVSLH